MASEFGCQFSVPMNVKEFAFSARPGDGLK
jgi:hypothetical protein